MSNGWSATDYVKSPAVAVGASATDSVVSREWPITAGGALNCVVKIVAASVTAGAGITAKLQTAEGSGWVDSKTVAITTNGSVYIKLQAAFVDDQDYLPLLNRGRLVVTTGAGSAVTITSVSVFQEL